MTKLFDESGNINIALEKEEKSVSVKLDCYKVKRYHIGVEPYESGNNISVYMSPSRGGDNEPFTGIKLKNMDELVELSERLQQIIFDYEVSINYDKEPF